MRRTGLHTLDPAPARKKIAAAKSNKPFMAALLDRGHRGHKDAVDQWTRLRQVVLGDLISQCPAAGDNRLVKIAGGLASSP